jgi:hypothetical protein
LVLIALNLREGAELVYGHTVHLFLPAGPDFSKDMVSRTSPTLWARAQRAEAPYASIHGLPTVAEIMCGLNPLTGALYLEAPQITRHAREMAALMRGKYPQPSTIFPGGLGIEAPFAASTRAYPARCICMLAVKSCTAMPPLVCAVRKARMKQHTGTPSGTVMQGWSRVQRGGEGQGVTSTLAPPFKLVEDRRWQQPVA